MTTPDVTKRHDPHPDTCDDRCEGGPHDPPGALPPPSHRPEPRLPLAGQEELFPASPAISTSERAAALILRAWVDCPSFGEGGRWGVLIGVGNLLRMHGLLDRHGDDPTPEGQALLDALERDGAS